MPILNKRSDLIKSSNATVMHSLSRGTNLLRFLDTIQLRFISLTFGNLKGAKAHKAALRRFVDEILKLHKEHGANFVIKYLKACHVAMQS